MVKLFKNEKGYHLQIKVSSKDKDLKFFTENTIKEIRSKRKALEKIEEIKGNQITFNFAGLKKNQQILNSK